MMPWQHGLPEATEFSLFPPAGQVRAYTKDKARTQELLRRIFPDLTFEIVGTSLGKKPVVIPILGEVGEGGRGIYAAAPSHDRIHEIEAKLATLDLAGAPQP